MTRHVSLRPNRYPDGPYQQSPCIWCRGMLKHTGATSGITWVPAWIPDRDWHLGSFCRQNVLEATVAGQPRAFGQHEPWEATPIQTPVQTGAP